MDAPGLYLTLVVLKHYQPGSFVLKAPHEEQVDDEYVRGISRCSDLAMIPLMSRGDVYAD
mgnify:CR=1 FL=1